MKYTATIFKRNDNEKDINVEFESTEYNSALIADAKKAIKKQGIHTEKGMFVNITFETVLNKLMPAANFTY